LEHENPTYRSSERVRHMENGLVTDDLLVTVKPSWAAGDTVVLSSIPWESRHISLSVQSEGAAGLIVDVGARSKDGETDDAQFFAAAVDASAVGVQDQMDHPVEFRNADDKMEPHVVYLTLGGAVTAGDRIWIVNQFRTFGLPASL